MKTTKSNRRMAKRIVSIILTAVILMSASFETALAGVNATADMVNDGLDGAASDSTAEWSDNTAERAFRHENYEIIYTVKSEWQNHQAIEMTLKNIGETGIKNWALSLETSGSVTGLWNAVLLTADENDGDIMLKNAGWNSVIQPGQSVVFGCTLEGENLPVPSEIMLCPVAEKTQETAEAELVITGEWEEGFQGEIHIHNHSESAVSGWSITFYANFIIENLWNGEFTSNEDGTYTVSHTVWQNEIPAAGEHVVGFTGTKTEEAPRMENCTVYGVEEYGKTGSSSGEDKPSTGDGKEEETKPDSGTGNQPEEPVDWEDTTDTDGDGLPDVYEKYMFESDSENADSDGDGLPDGYEVRSAGTSPVLADSNEDGISDGDSDEDGDGLTNMEEYLLGTNPLAKDTDYDGLEDREEIETYGTDPLNPDSDGDGISDGDEVALGLDPFNPATNGIPDNLYCIPQEIGTDSAILKDVNETAGNPYEVSLSVQASGAAKHNLSVDGTSYGTVFDSEAAVGSPVFIEYNDDMSLETLRLTYHVDEEIRENGLDLFGEDTTELHGIRRLNVFWFDEDINMLLPVETFHDEENGLVYADMDKDGVFCLMDMEKWIYGLAQESGLLGTEGAAYILESEDCVPSGAGEPERGSFLPDEEQYLESVSDKDEEAGEELERFLEEAEALFSRRNNKTDIKMSSMPAPASFYMDNEDPEEAEKSVPVDLVYILQTEGNDGDFVGNSWLIPWYDMYRLEEEYSNVRMCVLEERLDGTYTQAGKNRACWYESSGAYTDYAQHMPCKVTEETFYRSALDMVLSDDMDFRQDSVKLVMYVPAGITNIGFYHFGDCLTEMAERGICYSELHDNDNPYTIYTQVLRSYVEKTGGRFFSFRDVYWDEDVLGLYRDRIETFSAGKPQTVFKGITATGYQTVTLEVPLSSTGGWDSDHDGLTDWEEVNTELLLWNQDGSITLPTLLYCVENYSEDSYVIAGLERFKKDVTQHGVPSNIYEDYIRHVMVNTEILPIHSHPRRVDTDGDGILDYYNGRFESEYHFADPNPLKIDVRETALKNDFFSVDYEFQEGTLENWADVNGGSVASYGGNQSWFGVQGTLGDSKIFCNGTATGNDIQNYGCGIIAVADMFLYMALGDSKYNPTCNPPYEPGFGYDLSPALELGNSFGHLDFDTYIQYTSRVSNDFRIENILGEVGVPAFGPFRASLADGIYNISERNHMGLEGSWAPTFNSQKCLEIMKGMFENDIPVMFSYFTFDGDKNAKSLYRQFIIEEGNILKSKSVESHYMTATGIVEYSEDVGKILGFQRAIKVATWGQQFYMNYDDIGNHLDLFTNIYELYRVGE